VTSIQAVIRRAVIRRKTTGISAAERVLKIPQVNARKRRGFLGPRTHAALS
jgi:hypothetical protein